MVICVMVKVEEVHVLFYLTSLSLPLPFSSISRFLSFTFVFLLLPFIFLSMLSFPVVSCLFLLFFSFNHFPCPPFRFSPFFSSFPIPLFFHPFLFRFLSLYSFYLFFVSLLFLFLFLYFPFLIFLNFPIPFLLFPLFHCVFFFSFTFLFPPLVFPSLLLSLFLCSLSFPIRFYLIFSFTSFPFHSLHSPFFFLLLPFLFLFFTNQFPSFLFFPSPFLSFTLLHFTSPTFALLCFTSLLCNTSLHFTPLTALHSSHYVISFYSIALRHSTSHSPYHKFKTSSLISCRCNFVFLLTHFFQTFLPLPSSLSSVLLKHCEHLGTPPQFCA